MKVKWLKMKKSSFVEGTFIATAAIIFVKILGMLYVIPFYAIVGTEGAALYAYAYNIYNIFLDISTVGLPVAISKITNEYNTLKKNDAKYRAYKIAINMMKFISVFVFVLLFLFAEPIARLIIGNLTGGNSAADITSVIRCISFAILVIPYLSVTKGYLQGHNIINVSSLANVIEQVIRIIIILLGSYLVINVFNGSYVTGVEIALSGAFFGGLAAYIYIKIKMNRNKKELGLATAKKKDKITNKEITKKILMYSIPFIIINCVSSLYSFVDMVLVMRGMGMVGYNTKEVEFIATSISTWAGKINMIVISIAMGMTVSLIPSIVNSYTLKKWDDVNKKINTSLKMIIFISLPMAIGLSMLSKEVWAIFYGPSEIGATILSLSVFMAVFLNLYMVTSSIMQSLNRFGVVYKSAISGFLTNALLDLPLILLFNKIGIPSYLGAIVATIIGYSISIAISLVSIRKKQKEINYMDAIKTSFKILVPSLVMVLGLVLLQSVYHSNIDSNMSNLLYILVNAIVGIIIYFSVSYKMGLFQSVFGKEQMDKYLKKLRLLKD